MVLKQKTARKQGAPNSCCHRTIPTVSKSPSTILVWWPMPGCSFRPPWPGISACPNSSGSASTWAMPRGGRRLHRRRRCAACGADLLGAGVHGQSALHPPPSRGQALGTFLRSFRWGHVRQLDRVSRELLARARAAGAGPGAGPLTIDLDSTICETYGLAKEGARHHSLPPRKRRAAAGRLGGTLSLPLPGQ